MDEIYGFFISIFCFKILLFWQQFPFILSNMHLENSVNFILDFSWCVDLGPIFRSEGNSLLKCKTHRMNNNCLLSINKSSNSAQMKPINYTNELYKRGECYYKYTLIKKYIEILAQFFDFIVIKVTNFLRIVQFWIWKKVNNQENVS